MQNNTDTREGQTTLSAETNPTNRLVDPELEADFNDSVDEHYGADEETEFVAPSGSKASIGSQTIIGSDDDDDLSAFDPANFIAKATAIVAAMPAKKVDYIAVRKPSNTEYVRVTADKNYRMTPVYLLVWKKGMKEVHYLLTGKCVAEVIAAVGSKLVKSYSIVTAMSSTGDPFLWAVRELGDDESNEWLESARALQAAAVDGWLRVEGTGTHYAGIRPHDKLADPVWPKESFPKLLKLAFGTRVIDSVDHPVIKAVLGIKS